MKCPFEDEVGRACIHNHEGICTGVCARLSTPSVYANDSEIHSLGIELEQIGDRESVQAFYSWIKMLQKHEECKTEHCKICIHDITNDGTCNRTADECERRRKDARR